MFLDELQNRAHNGDQAAFRDIYNRYSREVYAVSHTALGSADNARAVVKQVFLHLYRELMRGESDLDLPARLSALTNEEIRIARIAAGELDPESLLVQYTVASAPTVDTTHTMDRIRAHMQQEASVEKSPEPASAESYEEAFKKADPDPTETALFEEPAPIPDLPKPKAAPVEPLQEEPIQPAPAQQTADPIADDMPKRKSRGGAIAAGCILFLLLVVFAWLIVGILMDLELLPFYDLGYSLFNKYVFDFFRLG